MSILISAGGVATEFPMPHASVPPAAVAQAGELVTIIASGPPVTALHMTLAPCPLVIDYSSTIREPRPDDPEDIERVLELPISPSPLQLEIATPGRFEFAAIDSHGVKTSIVLVICEPAAFDFIPEHQRSGGERVDKRRVLREVARHHSEFNGTRLNLLEYALANYGA
jgi:hypothetical protein